jgi:hypothetical protein
MSGTWIHSLGVRPCNCQRQTASPAQPKGIGSGRACYDLIETTEQDHALPDRHLTSKQRGNISACLEGSVTGPVSMTAAASDKEAVRYESEIADVLEEIGCEVEIDNGPRIPPPGQATASGVEMTIKEHTVRPVHARGIVRASRRGGDRDQDQRTAAEQ